MKNPRLFVVEMFRWSRKRCQAFINHEAWIEYSKPAKAGNVRAYLKWGHSPGIDGKLDPLTITNAFAREEAEPTGLMTPVFGFDDDASSRGGLFIEFAAKRPGAYALGLEYRRGVYTVTRSKKWIYGERKFVEGCGYDVEEAVLLMGSAKTYVLVGEHIVQPKPVGLKLEIVPSVVKKFASGDVVEVQVLYDSRPCSHISVTHSAEKKESITTDENGRAKIRLERGVNVLSANYSDASVKLEGAYDRVSITTTLSLITM